MTSELKQQYTLRITQASRTQLTVILYEIMLSYLKEAEEAHEDGNRAGFREGIRKARGCNNELMTSLNFQHEPAMGLLQLYLYVNREMARADIHNSTQELKNAEAVIDKLHKAYSQISSQDTSGPVMENAQTVYAGLTYGKNTLTESLLSEGSDRGFRA